MVMSNKLYDILKYIAIQVIPALDVLIIAIGEIWNIDVMARVAATVAAIGVFLGAILIKSTKDYKADSLQTNFNTDGVEMLMEVEGIEVNEYGDKENTAKEQ